MRLYALYSLNKKLLAALLVCFMTSLGVSGHIMATIQSKVTSTSCHRTLLNRILRTRIAVVMPSPLGGTICYPMNLTPTFYTFWIPLIVFECLLCGLAVFKGLQTMRHSGSIVASCSPFLSGILLSISLGERTSSFLKKDLSHSITNSLNRICMTYTVCLMLSAFTPVFSVLNLTISPDSLSTDVTFRCSYCFRDCDSMCSQ